MHFRLASCLILFISWLTVLMYSQSLSEESARYLGINCSQRLSIMIIIYEHHLRTLFLLGLVHGHNQKESERKKNGYVIT